MVRFAQLADIRRRLNERASSTPKHAFKIGRMNRREGQESSRKHYG